MRYLLLLVVLMMLIVPISSVHAQDDPCLSNGGMTDPDTGECHISLDMSIDINYPLEFTDYPFAMEAINGVISEEQAAFFSVFDYGPFYSPGPLTLYMEYSLYERSDNIVSILFTISTYTGGAHPNLFYQTVVLDLNNEVVLGFEDIFQEEFDQLEIIRPMIIADLNEQMAEIMPEGVWIDEETPREAFYNFVLTDDEIIFFFEPYLAAPYAAGPQQSSIPLADLQAVLAPPFFEGN